VSCTYGEKERKNKESAHEIGDKGKKNNFIERKLVCMSTKKDDFDVLV
jgi:hypothetical protein